MKDFEYYFMMRKEDQAFPMIDDYTDTMGHAGAILIDANHHLLMGKTEPGGDGLAAGY